MDQNAWQKTLLLRTDGKGGNALVWADTDVLVAGGTGDFETDRDEILDWISDYLSS